MEDRVALAAEDGRSLGYAEHLLVLSWRRIATGRSGCALMMSEFLDACGDDGPEVFVTFCTFLKALAVAGRRHFAVGALGSTVLTVDERQVLALIAAAQAQAAARLDAHLRWIAAPGKRHVLEIAASALSRALLINGLRLASPPQQMPTGRDRLRAVA